MRLLNSDNADYTQLPYSTTNLDFCIAAEFCAAKSLSTLLSHAEIWFCSHLQNPSTDVSAACLTFHPILGVVICLAVWHSISAIQTIKTKLLNVSDAEFSLSGEKSDMKNQTCAFVSFLSQT